MDLVPSSSPVYGGGLIMTFYPDDFVIPHNIRVFFQFKGCKKQHITEAAISHELNCFQATIPDHEPPEKVDFSVYILFNNSSVKLMLTEKFAYALDPTCFLARYLADSVHDVESLEDWDLIKDEGYCLENEDFETLDNRLTRAFKHLVLPDDWHILGQPENRHVKRETVFHFAARLGLIEFATYLLQKEGAEECLKVKNAHNELASTVARNGKYESLACVLSNPPKPIAEVSFEGKWIYEGSKIKIDKYSTSTITTKILGSNKLPFSPEHLVLKLSETSKTPTFRMEDVTGDLRNQMSLEDVPDDILHDILINEPSYSSLYNQNDSHLNAETNNQNLSQEKINEDCDVNKRFSLSCPDLNDQIPTVTTEKEKVLPQKPKIVPIRAPLETNDHLSVSNQRDHKDSSPTRPHSWHSSENLNEDDNRNYQFNYERVALERNVQDELNANTSTSLEEISLPASLINNNVNAEDDSALHHADKKPVTMRTRGMSYPVIEQHTDDYNKEERRFTFNGQIQVPKSLKQVQKPSSKSSLVVTEVSEAAKNFVTRKTSFFAHLRRSKKPKKSQLYVEPQNEAGKIVNHEDNTNSHKKLKEVRSATTAHESPQINSVTESRPKSMTVGSNKPTQHYPVGNNSSQSLGNQRPHSSVYGTQAYRTNTLLENPLFNRHREKHESNNDLSEGSDAEFENDLLNNSNRPEQWVDAVDKKVVKKMSKKEIKRQGLIYEFIQTERNYLRTLLVLEKVYVRGMCDELQMQHLIDNMFPRINQHKKFVKAFVKTLDERQRENIMVQKIGDLLVEHWSGSSGEEMKKLFGAFCSRNNEMLHTYRELLKNDKKFASFVKKSMIDPRASRKRIPECFMLITQRITKYPIMVNSLLKSTVENDHSEDYKDLEKALTLCKQLANDVDEQVKDRENYIKLIDVQEKTDHRCTTTFKDRKFDKKDFIRRKRKLILLTEPGEVKMVKDREKKTDIQMMVLSDCIVLLQENNGKFQFVPNHSVVGLKKMILRDMAYNKFGLILINVTHSQMVQLHCSSQSTLNKICKIVRHSIGNVPEDDLPQSEDESHDVVESANQEAHRLKSTKWNDLFEELTLKDEEIVRHMEEKMKIFAKHETDLKIPPLSTAEDKDLAENGDSFYPMMTIKEGETKSPVFPPTSVILGKIAQYASKVASRLEASSSIMPPKDIVEDFPVSKQAWVTENTSNNEIEESDMLGWFRDISHLCHQFSSVAQQQDTYHAKLLSMIEHQKSKKSKPGLRDHLEESELKRNQVKNEQQLNELRKGEQKLRSQEDSFERFKEKSLKELKERDAKMTEVESNIQKEREKHEAEKREIMEMKAEVQRHLERARKQASKMETSSSSSSLSSNKNNNHHFQNTTVRTSVMYPSNLSVHDVVKMRPHSPTNLSMTDAPPKPTSELPSHIRGSALNQSFAHNRVQLSQKQILPTGLATKLGGLASKDKGGKMKHSKASKSNISHSSSSASSANSGPSSSSNPAIAPAMLRSAPNFHHRRQSSEPHQLTVMTSHNNSPSPLTTPQPPTSSSSRPNSFPFPPEAWQPTESASTTSVARRQSSNSSANSSNSGGRRKSRKSAEEAQKQLSTKELFI